MREATENDSDLMTEVQSFWTEPALHIPLLDDHEICRIALAVQQWLKVCPISSPLAIPFKLVPNDRFPSL